MKLLNLLWLQNSLPREALGVAPAKIRAPAAKFFEQRGASISSANVATMAIIEEKE